MQTRSEQTRRRLILAGAEMFDRHGYANATIGQIAGAAGMTKGALYFHFASKDGLADAVQQRGRELLGDFVQRQWEQGAAPVQAVIDLTHWLAAKLRSDPLMRAGFRISKECTGRKPPVVGFHQVWITEVLRLLGQVRAAGSCASTRRRTDRRRCSLRPSAASRSWRAHPSRPPNSATGSARCGNRSCRSSYRRTTWGGTARTRRRHLRRPPGRPSNPSDPKWPEPTGGSPERELARAA